LDVRVVLHEVVLVEFACAGELEQNREQLDSAIDADAERRAGLARRLKIHN